MASTVEGIISIDKPAGLTSHDTVQIIRRISNVRRVGHTGTLDPLATGLLIVCVGRATRLAEYLVDLPKTYLATIRLGQATSTYDAEGPVLSDVPVMVNTPEIRMDCPEDRKFDVVTGLVEEFKKEYRVIDVDGARVLFDGGWGLVRASNTQPVLVLRFEANDETRLDEIRKIFMEKVERVLKR